MTPEFLSGAVPSALQCLSAAGTRLACQACVSQCVALDWLNSSRQAGRQAGWESAPEAVHLKWVEDLGFRSGGSFPLSWL